MMMRTDSMHLPALPPIVVALAAQAVAVLVVLVFVWLAQQFSTAVPRVSLLAWGVGVLAAVLGRRWGLPSWWWPLQLLFAPALYWGLQLNIPPWIYLGAFMLCLLVLGNSVSDRVPLYLSSQPVWMAVADLLPDREEFQFVDLGSGLGGGLRRLAPQFPGAGFVGVENSPLLWVVSRLLLHRYANAQLKLQSIWDYSLDDRDVVYAFLSPAPMQRLWEKAGREMKPGALFISNSFTVPGVAPDEQIELDDRRHSVLYVWRM